MRKKYEVTQVENNKFLFKKDDTAEEEVVVYLKKSPADVQPEFLLKTSEKSFSVNIDQSITDRIFF